jgi:hypothetical protein
MSSKAMTLIDAAGWYIMERFKTGNSVTKNFFSLLAKAEKPSPQSGNLRRF